MGNAVRPDEVSAILKKELAGYEQKADIYDAGTVVQVGDGIARVYGLEKVMAGELVEFPNDVMGMVLNLEEDNVGVILFGEETLIKRAIWLNEPTRSLKYLPVMRCSDVW